MDPITLFPEHPQDLEAARSIAARRGLPLSRERVPGFQLVLTAERLQLEENGLRGTGAIYVDLVGGSLGHRRRFGGGRGQPLAKAVGLRGAAAPRILDATAGFGRDAFVLACLGCRVTLVERSSVVVALLEDGLRRAERDETVGPIVRERLTLWAGDAIPYMRALTEAQRPDVVYLDPMFPARSKTALVKKEMQVLQRLIGHDPRAEGLLDTALRAARERVVVKRPADAAPLSGRRPTLAFATKKHRFDVYVIKALGRDGVAPADAQAHAR